MKSNGKRFELGIILHLSIALVILGFFLNNAIFIVYGQVPNNSQSLDSSKEFIKSIFNQVNNASSEYQKELATKNEMINNENNMTIVNKTDAYINKIGEIISLAKEYNIHEDYKPIVDNYIKSLQNEVESYTHYKNYILTNNNTENKLSIDLLSNALNYETEAIKEFKELQD